MYDKSVFFLSRIHDFLRLGSAGPSKKLVRSVEYLGKKQSLAEKVVKAGRIVFILSIIIGLISLFFIGFSLINTALILITGVLINHFYSDYYKNKYDEERIRDLSRIPDFFSLLITNLKTNPNFEKSLEYITTYDFGRITSELRKVVRGIRTGRETDAKKSFLKIMKDFNDVNVFNAANNLVSSLSIRSEDRRNKMLNKSLNSLLKGFVEDARKYSNNIYLPMLLVFGFGTIIPLIIISFIPIISFFTSSSINMVSISIVFVASLVINYLVINWLKNRSPPRFSQIIIEQDEKGISSILLIVLFLGVCFPSILFFLSEYMGFVFVLFNGFQTLFFYAGVSIVLFLFFFSRSKDLVVEAGRLRLLEKGIINSFYSLSSRISEGYSVEKSIGWVSEVLDDGVVKDFYKKAKMLINKGVGLDKVFEKAHLLGGLSSQRIKGLSDLFVMSVTKHSRAASENIVNICDFYSSIISVEKELDNIMSRNTEMIKLTGLFFTPFICGLVVNIQRLLNENMVGNTMGFLSMSFAPVNNELVLFIVSLYVLGLTFLLARLYSFINSGGDVVSSRQYYGFAFLTSCMVFTATLIMTRFLL